MISISRVAFISLAFVTMNPGGSALAGPQKEFLTPQEIAKIQDAQEIEKRIRTECGCSRAGCTTPGSRRWRRTRSRRDCSYFHGCGAANPGLQPPFRAWAGEQKTPGSAGPAS